MTTYFGLCDSAGNPTASTAGNTGAAETDWNSSTIYTCPGSGSQTIVEITADLKNVTNYNARLAVYSTSGTTLIAQGTAAVAIVGASDSWQGHIGQSNITPNPATLTGGVNYLIVLSGSGDIQSDHSSSGVSGLGKFAAADETGGYPASLPASADTALIFPVRVGVNPTATIPSTGAYQQEQSTSDRYQLEDGSGVYLIEPWGGTGVFLPPFIQGDLTGIGTPGRFFKDRLN